MHTALGCFTIRAAGFLYVFKSDFWHLHSTLQMTKSNYLQIIPCATPFSANLLPLYNKTSLLVNIHFDYFCGWLAAFGCFLEEVYTGVHSVGSCIECHFPIVFIHERTWLVFLGLCLFFPLKTKQTFY